MRIADEVFERLKNGEGPEEVRAGYRSQSQVTEGFRLYREYQVDKTGKLRASPVLQLILR